MNPESEWHRQDRLDNCWFSLFLKLDLFINESIKSTTLLKAVFAYNISVSYTLVIIFISVQTQGSLKKV